MFKNNRVLIVSLIALVLTTSGAVVWLTSRPSAPAASRAPPAASAASPTSAVAIAAPSDATPPPPPPPANEAQVSAAQPGAADLPTQIGQCATTTVKSVSTRLEDTPGSGSAIDFANGGSQVSYDQTPEVDASQPGDLVQMCLVETPQDCPAGDNRGAVYKSTNLRTGQSWTLPDSEHACGGA